MQVYPQLALPEATGANENTNGLPRQHSSKGPTYPSIPRTTAIWSPSNSTTDSEKPALLLFPWVGFLR